MWFKAVQHVWEAVSYTTQNLLYRAKNKEPKKKFLGTKEVLNDTIYYRAIVSSLPLLRLESLLVLFVH